MSDTFPTVDEIWGTALPLLLEQVGKPIVSVLTRAAATSWDGTTFALRVTDDLAKHLLEAGHHHATIIACLEQITKHPVILRVVVGADSCDSQTLLSDVGSAAPKVTVLQPRIVRPSHEIFDVAPLNQRHTFDNFVVADCNRLAHSTARQICLNPGGSYNPLFIHSKAGLGKTHLMQAIGHEIRLNNKDAEVVYLSAESFVNQLISAIRDNRTAEFRRRYRYVDVWLVDDVQFISSIDGPASEEEFFHTFNTLLLTGKQVVLASDAPPRDLRVSHDRLSSRMQMGILADLRVPDIETRVTILEKRAATEKVYFDRHILEYLAKKVQSNIRVLEGALLKLCAYSSLNGAGVFTTTLVDEIIADYSPSSEGKRVTFDEILKYVSQRLGCPAGDITSPKRGKAVAWPRQLVMYLSRELTDMTWEEIGSKFRGSKAEGKDHTTVIWSYNKVADLVSADPQVLWLMNDMKAQLRDQ